MVFNTKVESLSTFDLLNERDEEIPVHNISVEGATMVGSLEEALPTGSYRIAWKIVGADGHPIKGEIPFSVQLPEAVSPESSPEIADEQSTTIAAEEEPLIEGTKSSVESENERNSVEDKRTEDNQARNSAFIAILGAACIVIAGLFLWRRGRGKG